MKHGARIAMFWLPIPIDGLTANTCGEAHHDADGSNLARRTSLLLA